MSCTDDTSKRYFYLIFGQFGSCLSDSVFFLFLVLKARVCYVLTLDGWGYVSPGVGVTRSSVGEGLSWPYLP